MRVEPSAKDAAIQAISRGAAASGGDFSLLLATAKRESGLNRNAHAATSSAAGLFQFVDSTWMSLVQRYGAKHGLDVDAADPAQRGAILDLRYDPQIAATMAGELAHENEKLLAAKLGRAPSAGELYAAHVLGPAAAGRMIAAANGGEAIAAASLAPRAAAANRALFYDADGAARTPAAVLAKLNIAPAPLAVSAAQSPAPLAPPAAPPSAAETDARLNLAAPRADLWTLAVRAYHWLDRL